jgi:hypothetical protein
VQPRHRRLTRGSHRARARGRRVDRGAGSDEGGTRRSVADPAAAVGAFDGPTLRAAGLDG